MPRSTDPGSSSPLTRALASSFDAAELAELLGLFTGVVPDGLELGLDDLAARVAGALAGGGSLGAVRAMPLDDQQAALVERVAALDTGRPAQDHSVTAPVRDPVSRPGLGGSGSEEEEPDLEEDTAPRLRDQEEDTQPELAGEGEHTDPHLLVMPVVQAAEQEREITDVGVPIHELAPPGDPRENTAPVPARRPPGQPPPKPRRVRLYSLVLVAELLFCVWLCTGFLGGDDEGPVEEALPMASQQGPSATLGVLAQGGSPAQGSAAAAGLGDLSAAPTLRAPQANLAARPRGQPSNQLHTAVPDKLGMRFVGLTEGEFTMGAGEADTFATAHERPAHRVRIRAFWLAETEVSVGQWYTLQGKVVPSNANHRDAMGGVSWCDAVRYANLLSREDGFLPFYTDTDTCESAGGVSLTVHGDGYRLPTEAEWEYAARAGRLEPPSEPIPCLRSRFSSSSTGNVWKFKGMNGVVWEWVWDVKAPYRAQSRVDAVWPMPGRDRVLRGGSFASPDMECGFTARNAAELESRTEDLGFRLARSK